MQVPRTRTTHRTTASDSHVCKQHAYVCVYLAASILELHVEVDSSSHPFPRDSGSSSGYSSSPSSPRAPRDEALDRVKASVTTEPRRSKYHSPCTAHTNRHCRTLEKQKNTKIKWNVECKNINYSLYNTMTIYLCCYSPNDCTPRMGNTSGFGTGLLMHT